MSQEKFIQEVANLIEDYLHNNNILPCHLLINPVLLECIELEGIELQIVTTAELDVDEVVVY